MRDKDDYSWFWNAKEFPGDRVNDVHLTITDKQAARQRKLPDETRMNTR